MRVGRFTINGEQASTKTKEFLLQHYSRYLTSEYNHTLMIWRELYYARFGTRSMTNIVLDYSHPNKAQIQIISVAGRKTIWDWFWGTEKDLISMVRLDLVSFCNQHNIKISDLEVEKYTPQ